MATQRLPVTLFEDLTGSPQNRSLRRRLVEILNLLAQYEPSEGPWTPVVRGSGTAGTYEATTTGRYTRIGRRVIVDFKITLAGAVTGGGTGDLNITGLPFALVSDTSLPSPMGSIALHGIDFTANAHLTVSFTAFGATSLKIDQTVDLAGQSAVPISGVGAGDIMWGSLCYETDDP